MKFCAQLSALASVPGSGGGIAIADFEPPGDAVNVTSQLVVPSEQYPHGALVVSWVELTAEERRDLQYQQAVGNGKSPLIG